MSTCLQELRRALVETADANLPKVFPTRRPSAPSQSATEDISETKHMVWIEGTSSAAVLPAEIQQMTFELWECSAEGAFERWFGCGKAQIDVLVAGAAFWADGLQAAAFVQLLRGKCRGLLVLCYGPKETAHKADVWAGTTPVDVTAVLYSADRRSRLTPPQSQPVQTSLPVPPSCPPPPPAAAAPTVGGKLAMGWAFTPESLEDAVANFESVRIFLLNWTSRFTVAVLADLLEAPECLCCCIRCFEIHNVILCSSHCQQHRPPRTPPRHASC